MELLEKVAYVKGLMAGLDMDAGKKETKLLKAIIDLLDDMAASISDVEEESSELSEYVEELDEDLGDLESYVFGEDEDECDCGCEDCDDEGEVYEVTCPNCEATIYLDEEMLDEGEMECPCCGQKLEFDLDCGCCDDECDCDEACDCSDDCCCSEEE